MTLVTYDTEDTTETEATTDTPPDTDTAAATDAAPSEEIGWQELQKALAPNILSKLLQRRQVQLYSCTIYRVFFLTGHP